MITFDHVSFSYPGQADGGLKNIDLTVVGGECVLLCGRSGCGKTTVTRLANGLIPHFYAGELSGRVLVNGRDVAETPMHELAGEVGSVFQNPRTQFFNVDTDSEIAFGIENEGLPTRELRRRVDGTAEELGLKHLLGRSLFELSGGEKQKIAFASVYAMGPRVLLLDEPSSNLDTVSIQALRRHLGLVKAQGRTILIAEHRLYYLMDLADRILYLDEGRVRGEYTPAEFQALTKERREAMGLRGADLREAAPPERTAAAPAPVLELRDMELRQGKRTILEHISLTAGPGEIIGVVGRNGAGKTTFSRALCGLHKANGGAFLWQRRQVDRAARRKRSYMVMQDVNYQLFAESVEAECAFGLHRPDRDLARRTLEELNLGDCLDRHPNTLSGGQKQRLAVAVSMVCGKELLVFDEPTSGLDLDSMVQVAGLMRALAAQGKVIFVVTHDFELVCRACTRLLHFDEGEMPDDLPVTPDTLDRLRTLFD